MQALTAIGRGDAAAVRDFAGAIDASAALFKALGRSTPNRQQVLQALRDKGVDFDTPFGSFGSHAIVWGAQQDFITANEFDWLLKHSGADVNARDGNGDLALHRAIGSGNTRKLWLLLQRPDVDIDARDSCDASPADVVASLSDATVRAEMQRMLAARRDGFITMMPMPGVAATIPDDVLRAVRAGDTATVEAYSGDLNVRCDDRVTVVQLALQVQPTARRLAMLRVLKAKGVNFDAPFGNMKVLPVVYVSWSLDMDAETLRWLVNEGGVDVNQRDARGTFALHEAVEAGDVDKVEVLLSRRDLDVDAVNGVGVTAIQVAQQQRLDFIVDCVDSRRLGMPLVEHLTVGGRLYVCAGMRVCGIVAFSWSARPAVTLSCRCGGGRFSRC
jgi:ankyrin repeat protein